MLEQVGLLLSYNRDMENYFFNVLVLGEKLLTSVCSDVLTNDMYAIRDQINDLARSCIPAVHR